MNKKTAFLLIGGILLAIIVISVISFIFFGEKREVANIYISTEGFGEDKDVDGKLFAITPGDSIQDVFGLKYKEIYEFFGKPLIRQNEFIDFLGKKKVGTANIRVYINDELTLDLAQAYLGDGAQIHVVYNEK